MDVHDGIDLGLGVDGVEGEWIRLNGTCIGVFSTYVYIMKE